MNDKEDKALRAKYSGWVPKDIAMSEGRVTKPDAKPAKSKKDKPADDVKGADGNGE